MLWVLLSIYFCAHQWSIPFTCLQDLSFCISLSKQTLYLCCWCSKRPPLRSRCTFPLQSRSAFTSSIFLFPFPQSIKVCLRTPSPSSRVLRPRGRASTQPGAPRHRPITTWGPAPSTLCPSVANRGLKTPLIWARRSVRRLAQFSSSALDMWVVMFTSLLQRCISAVDLCLSFFFFSNQVNDLLRRKEPSHLGDIGVTEVNKNVDAVWSCMDQLTQTTANRYTQSTSPWSVRTYPLLNLNLRSSKTHVQSWASKVAGLVTHWPLLIKWINC